MVYGKFPIRYLEYVTKYSEDANIDKSLIFAIIKVESDFDANAVSNKGAYGIMQIMPDTARWIEKGVADNELKDPSTNIRIGTRYLRYLMDKYMSNELAMIAAYNAGEGNVDRWLASKDVKNGDKSHVLTIEDIEFSETRLYVLKVRKYRDYYKFLYNLE